MWVYPYLPMNAANTIGWVGEASLGQRRNGKIQRNFKVILNESVVRGRFYGTFYVHDFTGLYIWIWKDDSIKE